MNEEFTSTILSAIRPHSNGEKVQQKWLNRIQGQIYIWRLKFNRMFPSWERRNRVAIEAGVLPSTFTEYAAAIVYKNRFGWSLFFVVVISLGFISILGLNVTHEFLDKLLRVDQKSKVVFILGVISSPMVVFAWFIRAYERARMLGKEEAALWSDELNNLLNQAVDTKQELALRLVAIRQLQDYLTGVKWKVNQAANSTSILQAFSIIIASHKITDSEKNSADDSSIPSPILKVIGLVVRNSLKKIDGYRTLRVIDNSLSELDLSSLNLSKVDFTGLRAYRINFESTKLSDANLQKVDFALANFKNALMIGSDLQGSEFLQADLQNTDLCASDMRFCKLHSTNLEGAIMQNTDLRGTSFLSTNLVNADLFYADLRGCYGLTCEQLQKNKNWKMSIRDECLACGEKIPSKPR